MICLLASNQRNRCVCLDTLSQNKSNNTKWGSSEKILLRQYILLVFNSIFFMNHPILSKNFQLNKALQYPLTKIWNVNQNIIFLKRNPSFPLSMSIEKISFSVMKYDYDYSRTQRTLPEKTPEYVPVSGLGISIYGSNLTQYGRIRERV